MSQLFDYEVQDAIGEKVGKVENVWTEQGQPAYLGISTGWLGLGQSHVIPTRGMKVNQQEQTITVPYAEEIIKSSPNFALDEELLASQEEEVDRHYGLSRGTAGAVAPRAGATGITGVADKENCGCSTDPSRVADTTGTVEVPLAEEKLHVGKREIDKGEVRLRKVVRTEVVNRPVELRHEEVVVERVSGGSTPGSEAFVEDVIRIPVKDEEAVISKTVESAGAVKATKVAHSTEEQVSGTVRKEDVEVERDLAGTR